MKTITISKGNQYDRDGFRMTDGVCRSYGSADANKDNGYCLDGNLWPWCFPNENEINNAILDTLADGQERIIKIADESNTTPKAETEFKSTSFGLCPHCHSYCCGDCMTN